MGERTRGFGEWWEAVIGKKYSFLPTCYVTIIRDANDFASQLSEIQNIAICNNFKLV